MPGPCANSARIPMPSTESPAPPLRRTPVALAWAREAGGPGNGPFQDGAKEPGPGRVFLRASGREWAAATQPTQPIPP